MRVKVWVQRFKDRSTLQLQWMDPVTGKRRTRSAETSNEGEAEQARADLEYELTHGLYSEPSRITWPDFREAFEDEYLPSVRANTGICYRKALDLFEELTRPFPQLLSGVTARTVSSFTAALRNLPAPKRGGITSYKATTIAIHLQYLRGALSWAAEQKMLAALPAFPSIVPPEPIPQPVPAELYERLLAAAGEDLQMRAFLQLGWLAGLRRNEARYLCWEQSDTHPWIDFGRRRINFPAEAVKGARDQWVPIDPGLQDTLQQLPRGDGFVFTFTKNNGSALGKGSLSARVTWLARKACAKLSFRSLRRGFGCRHAARVPAQVLQRLMRHRSIKTTLRYYANIDDAVDEAILGPRNGSRNTQAAQDAEKRGKHRGDASDSHYGD